MLTYSLLQLYELLLALKELHLQVLSQILLLGYFLKVEDTKLNVSMPSSQVCIHKERERRRRRRRGRENEGRKRRRKRGRKRGGIGEGGSPSCIYIVHTYSTHILQFFLIFANHVGKLFTLSLKFSPQFSNLPVMATGISRSFARLVVTCKHHLDNHERKGSEVIYERNKSGGSKNEGSEDIHKE